MRYTTSPPHYHAGDDIGAAEGADIIAPFDGVVKNGYNSLGGNSVDVYGKDGYVYNAHLSAYEGSYPRHVDAGDVIGHVGMTGDAMGGVNHDHFEWHPNNTGGARTINGAVDPYPFLQEVCHK
jgi:murein DD-endopeptidase MepM/ murein hydrolase activator NlpD